MIGWWIVIAAQTPEERDRAGENSKLAVLANWEVGSGGIEWLSRLVKADRARQLSFNGYPNRFTALASEILPLLANGPPAHQSLAIIGDDYVLPKSWTDQVIFHREKIAACPPDQLLTIDAWDLS